MKRGTNTSVRLPPQLVDQLEHAATSLHRGKNWIIVKALEEYLGNMDKQMLRAEAKRQSIIATQAAKKNEAWDEDTDTTGWI
jgi:predicted transcriptional regulator